jgi:hypothetical protein
MLFGGEVFSFGVFAARESENASVCFSARLNELEHIHDSRKPGRIAWRHTTTALKATGANVNTVEHPILSAFSADTL